MNGLSFILFYRSKSNLGTIIQITMATNNDTSKKTKIIVQLSVEYNVLIFIWSTFGRYLQNYTTARQVVNSQLKNVDTFKDKIKFQLTKTITKTHGFMLF